MTNPAPLPDRAVIRLTGEDRFSFLQGIITQDVERLKTAPAIFSALLTPQGKILFDFFIASDGDALLIDCFTDAAAALLKRLTLYKLRAKVSLDLAEDLKVVASAEKIENGFPDPRHTKLGWRAIVSETAEGANREYDRARIALGVPDFGKDFSADEVFLLDVNYDLLNGVNYKKGCFVGQEVTSRMKRKGDVRRRTLIAKFDGPAAEKGAPVTAGGSTLGETMSAADGVALAIIRLDRWEKAKAKGTPIECGGKQLLLEIPDYLEQG
ncbi:CAF17-like 4Fe-4S cluster assembly/insertion protein YgfZ [Hyphococcus sp.]|uniref:CAF17-like 4Fe-4S cluster assembly/insertion protein YgfZ n=1 Tax=Hyphococcus sp. TaxID=2038636 RepID=UPI0035C6CED8